MGALAMAQKSLANGLSATHTEGTVQYVRLRPVALMGMLWAGCISAPAPHEKAASSEAAVQSAEEVGAGDVPEAIVYLGRARKELDQGKALMRSGKNHEAAAALDMAQADAELALAVARESRTRTAAQQAKARAHALRAGISSGNAIGGGPLQPPPPAPSVPTPIQPTAPLTPPAQAPAQPHR